MSLDTIVNVSITRETAAVSQAGFGAVNFLSNNAVFQERIKEYSSFASVQSDTLVGADTLIFAAKYFGQPIRPVKFYVTKKGRDLARVQTITFDADIVTANTVNVVVDGGTPIAEAFATDHDTTMTNLAASIQGEAGVVTAVVSAPRVITVTGAVNVAVVLTVLTVTGGASQANIALAITQYEDAVATDVASLTAAAQVDNDWYGLAAYTHVKADILLLAAWIQPQRKLYGAASLDSDVVTSATTDVGTALKAAGYDRTFVAYSLDSANFPEGAWMGAVLPHNPGSITWKFKSLAGITVDTLTDTEKSNADGKNVNTYTVVGGANITEEGKTSEGTFIDIIRSVDWMQARIQETIFSSLVNVAKIPFTDDGVNIIVNGVTSVLELAESPAFNIITNDPKFSVTAPLVANISVNDRANRILPDVTFEAVLAGAIHNVTVIGTVSV